VLSVLEAELLLDGAVDAPPAAESFFSSVDAAEPLEGALGAALDEELEEPLAGALGCALDEELEELDWSFLVMSTEAEPDCEPDGA
jgi:hypothetical protein